MKISGILALISLGLICGASNGETITFSDLTGPNGAPFTSYTQGDFTVSAFGGWEQGLMFGKSPPRSSLLPSRVPSQ